MTTLTVPKVVSHSVEADVSSQLREEILVATASQRRPLVKLHKILEFSSKTVHRKRKQSCTRKTSVQKKNRSMSVLGLKRSSTMGEAVEAVLERRDHK